MCEIVGVHIRMQSNIELDVPGINQLPAGHAAGTESMGPVQRKRNLCNYREFIPKLKTLSQQSKNVSFLVASDSAEATRALRGTFGEKVLQVEVGEECLARPSRSTECAQAALVEFLALSEVSSSLILSDWSSASELIRRLSAPKPYYSGCSRECKGCACDIVACLKRPFHA